MHLAHSGHQVVGSVRRRDGSYENVLPFEVVEIDVTDRDSVARGVHQAVERLGGLDGLVNNAGVSQLCAVEDLDENDFKVLLDTNCTGALRMCQAVLPVMRQGGGGVIVNVSSMNAQAPFPFTGGYAASKAALEALSEALALEVARFDIRVAIVQPGVFDTDISSKSLPRRVSAVYPGEVEVLELNRGAAAAEAPPVLEVARAIESLLLSEEPPVRSQVGRDAKGIARRRREMSDEAFRLWVREVSGS